jgi:hypothetical protein
MNTLKDVSCDIIRQNWLNYKDEINNSSYYELLWKSLEDKFSIDNNDIYLIIFKNFINNKEINYKKPLFDRIHICQLDNSTLIIKGLSSDERKNIHSLCDKIGLHHESKTQEKNKYNRFLYIYKPTIWLWEYTEKNPYSKSKEFYERRELEKQKHQQWANNILNNTKCYVCSRNGLETDLFYSVYVNGIYCDDCLQITTDEEGRLLNGHKFELIEF